MASEIASDPRFSHVLTDPRFKTIPRRSRKVRIGSRFQSMFTDHMFKVKYDVDKRGRRVQQTSSEDVQRYYDLHDDAVQNAMTSHNRKPSLMRAQRLKKKQSGESVANGNYTGCEEANEESLAERDVASVSEGDSEGDGVSVSERDSEGESDSSTDVEDVLALRDPEVVHGWWDDEVAPSHSIRTGSRLALCRMDWDRINATDMLVFLGSFKPQGGSILRVAVLPSDFGLERMKCEDVKGPAELLDQSNSSTPDEVSLEGRGYSNEHLRQYQLQRLNYYYAVVECDSKATAEHVYEQCDGIQYEHCGGRLDLRFIPDDMTFDDREPKSVATDSSVPVGYIPPEFVTTALQQSKVQLTWDETDPQRLQTTMRKFSRDDMLKMDFDAYLASSSDESGSECGTPGGVCGEPKKDHSVTNDRVAKYRSLLSDTGDSVSGGGEKVEEVMEITWEPGLQEEVQEMVRRRRGEEGEKTTWDQYIRDRKTRRKKTEIKGSHGNGNHGNGGQSQDNLGFDDPFFKDDVAIATTGKSSSKKKRSKVKEQGGEKQEKSELELLMMEGEEEGGRAHFSLNSILESEKSAGKKTVRRRKRREGQPVMDDSFKVDVNDERFSALYSNHQYAPDPAHPHYRSSSGMAAIMEERRKRREMGRATVSETTPSSEQEHSRVFSDPSVGRLVKAVRSKTHSLNERREKLRAKRKAMNT